MADPVRQRVLNEMKATFEAMPAGRTQFGAVLLEDWADRRRAQANTLSIIEGIETYVETMGAKALDRTLEIELRLSLHVPRDQAPTDVFRTALADVEEAAMADVTWGGHAMQTRLLSNLRTVDDSNDRLIEVSVSVEVKYRTRRRDPRA